MLHLKILLIIVPRLKLLQTAITTIIMLVMMAYKLNGSLEAEVIRNIMIYFGPAITLFVMHAAIDKLMLDYNMKEVIDL